MATSKKTPAAKTKAPKVEKDNVAKVAFEQAKDAIPSMDSVAKAATDATDYLKDQTNVDFQGLADDASNFVRRNPGTSLAAAAGLGVLIGILATKRS